LHRWQDGKLTQTVTLTGQGADLLQQAAAGPKTVNAFLGRAATTPTVDQLLWSAIRNRTDAIDFDRYAAFINRLLCDDDNTDSGTRVCEKPDFSRTPDATGASGLGAPSIGERKIALGNQPSIYGIDAYQHGIRDPDYLARLAFYSLGRFGYCPPQGSGLASWRQHRLRATALLKVPVPTIPDIGSRSCVGRGENKRDVARPDAPALDITGRYYFWQDRKPFATVLINQAGRHITMRATLLLSAIDRQRLPDRPYKEYNGDLQADGTFRVFNRDKLTEQGTIFRKDGRLFLQMERPSRPPATEFVRVEGRPTLLAPALDLVRSFKQGPLGKVLERHELYPLAPGQIRRIRELVKKSLMDALISRFFQTSDHKKKYNTFVLMVKQVAKLTKEFHPSDLPLVRLYALEELSVNKWTSPRNVRRSHLDWIQMMTDWVRSETKPGTYD
jgi:hypothetical protein